MTHTIHPVTDALVGGGLSRGNSRGGGTPPGLESNLGDAHVNL